MKSVIVYADESGTHDIEGSQKGSKYPVVGSLAAPVSEWSKFRIDWAAILASYRAPYFHFREWSDAWAFVRHSKPETDTIRSNPYFGWSRNQLEDFLHTLAKVAAKGKKLIVMGSIRLLPFNSIKSQIGQKFPESDPALSQYPYTYVIALFFASYCATTTLKWGNFQCPVSFVFEDKEDEQWRTAVKSVYTSYRNHDPRFHSLEFVSRHNPAHSPVQAADLYAYRVRQKVDKSESGAPQAWNDLDEILFAKLRGSKAKHIGV